MKKMIHRFVRRGIKIFAAEDWEISNPILERNVASSQTLDRSQVESIVATFYRFFQKIKEYLFLISNKMLDVNGRMFRRCLEVEISNLVLLFYEMEIEKIEMLKPPIEKFRTRKIWKSRFL